MTRQRVLQGSTQTGVSNRSREISGARHKLLQSGVTEYISEVPPYQPWFHRRVVPVGEQASYFGTEDTNWSAGRGTLYGAQIRDDGRSVTARYHVEGTNPDVVGDPMVLTMYPMRFETQAATGASHNEERRAQVYWSHLIARGIAGLTVPETYVRKAPGAISDGVVSGGHIGSNDALQIRLSLPFATQTYFDAVSYRGNDYTLRVTHVRLLQNGVAKTDPLPVTVSMHGNSGQGAYWLTPIGTTNYLMSAVVTLNSTQLAGVTIDLDHALQFDVWVTLTHGGGNVNNAANEGRYWIGACTATTTRHDFPRYFQRALKPSAYQFRAGWMGFRGPEVNHNFNYAAHTWQVTFPNTTDWTGTNATTWKLEDGDGWTVTKHSQAGTRLEFGDRAYFEIKFDSELPEVWIYDPDGEVMASFGGLGLGVVSGGPMIYVPQSDGNFPPAITSPGGISFGAGGTRTSYDQGLFYDNGSTTTMTRVLYNTELELSTDFQTDPNYPYYYIRRISVSDVSPVPTPWFPATIDVKRVSI